MKLVSYSYSGQENVGVLVEDKVIPINDIISGANQPQICSMIELIEKITSVA
jgi:hypothetical protein